MIVRNPNSATALANRIDKQSESPINYVTVDSHNINGAAFELDVSEDALSWKVKEVALAFSNANARDFAISKVAGARILPNLNDWFWIQHSTLNSPRRAIIPDGLYTSTTDFATAIKAGLDAVADFAAAGITFTVVFAAATSKYTITPSSGTISFVYDTGTTSPVAAPTGNISVAGPMMGFTADTAPLAASITSDTGIDVGTVYAYVTQTANAVTSYVLTDVLEMDMDSVLRVTGTIGVDVVMTARVTHEVVLSIR